MRLKLSAIGKLKSNAERELCDFYLTSAQKIGRSLGISGFSVIEYPESRASSAQKRCQEETDRLFFSLAPREEGIVFDRQGLSLSSEELALHLAKSQTLGSSGLHFFLGGPDGFSPLVQERGMLRWSLGPMTWPHRLARIMVLEQIYRGLTILGGHPYHRE